MTYEFSPVTDEPRERRPITDFIPWMRCTELIVNGELRRPGKLLIVRPLKMIEDYRPLQEGQDPNKWRGKLTVVDVACLDPIDRAVTEMGEELPGFPAGTIFRNNVVKLGYLNKAFRDHVGGMVIGTIYPVKTQYPRPSIHWRDLFADEAAKARAQGFFKAFPQFFTPVPDPYEQRNQQAQPSTAAPSAATDPWATSNGAPGPASSAGSGYQQPDPWAQQAVQPVSPDPAQHANQGMSTIEQIRQAAVVNAQGQAQSGEPPF